MRDDMRGDVKVVGDWTQYKRLRQYRKFHLNRS